MGGVGPLLVVKCDPALDPEPSLGFSFPSVRIDAFISQGPQETLDEEVLKTTPFAVHLDPGANPFRSVCPDEEHELAALKSHRRSNR